jgi:CheY-like chemotaxis protein
MSHSILLVDDNDSNLKLAQEILVGAGNLSGILQLTRRGFACWSWCREPDSIAST